jgi:hypothetical protein
MESLQKRYGSAAKYPRNHCWNRFVIAAESLQKRFAIALQSLQNRCAINAQLF